MARPIITVVGSFAIGMTLRTTRMPVLGETLLGSGFDMGPGGKGSNQAVGAARLGADTSFVGIIGRDNLGDIAIDLYDTEGIDSTHVLQSGQAPTGVGFIILNEAGENGIILDMGANALMDAAFVDRASEQISRSELVITVLEQPVAAAAQALALGKKYDVQTLLNPAPAQPLDSAILHNVDVLTPNETEIRILLGLAPDDPTSTSELAGRLISNGVNTLVVTRGTDGALIMTDEGMHEVDALEVDVVDTTGAGDAFNAALAVALAEGRDLLDAVRFANCAGAIACTKLGVVPALAERAAVDSLYAKHYAGERT